MWDMVLYTFLAACLLAMIIMIFIAHPPKKLWVYIVGLIPALIAGIAALVSFLTQSKKPGGKDETNIDAPVTSDDLTKPIGSGDDKSGRGKSNSEIIDTIERNTTDIGHTKKPY